MCVNICFFGKQECFICKQRLHWKCIRCTIASHDKCAPWPDKVMHLNNQPGKAICWRHPTDWRVDLKVNFLLSFTSKVVFAFLFEDAFSCSMSLINLNLLIWVCYMLFRCMPVFEIITSLWSLPIGKWNDRFFLLNLNFLCYSSLPIWMFLFTKCL